MRTQGSENVLLTDTPYTTLTLGCRQVPGIKGRHDFSTGEQPTQKNKRPTVNRMLREMMIAHRSQRIHLSDEMRSTETAKDVLLQAWLATAAVSDQSPSKVRWLIRDSGGGNRRGCGLS